MLYVRRGFGDEKTQLNELNKRLDQYLSRVRQLEAENQVLVEEIHRLRQERGAEWAQDYFNEICQLRRKVEELSVEKCEAELQKDNLWQELQDLQELWEQVKSMRLKIDQQLVLYKQDLQQAKRNQAALEELYLRLQGEWQMLQTSQKEEMFALRDQALQMPLQITMQEVVRPRLSMTDVQRMALEISESWKDTFLVYQKKIEELENTLRLDVEDRLGVEEEVRIQKIQIEELRREHEELMGIQRILEKELLRMKEKYRMEEEEYQIIIEELENEKRSITLTITERLKDYHDLTQVKTGLSLEVAAYRALLEAESKKGTVIWTEHSVRDRPAGYITSTFEESTKYSHRGTEYPPTRCKEGMRNKDTMHVDRFLTRTVPQQQITPKYSSLGNASSSYVSRVYENTAQDKSRRWDTGVSSRYNITSTNDFPQTVYRPVQTTVFTPYSSTQSTIIRETKKEEKVKDLKPVARPRTHSKEAKKLDAHRRTEDKKQDFITQRTLETKVNEESKVTSKPIEKIQQNLETNYQYSKKDTAFSEEATSIAESVTKETIQEPKLQEIPVKKERKKREQAKKRKEELEKVEDGEMNVAAGSKVDTHETTHVRKSVVLGENKSGSDQQIVLEIPIQLDARKSESSTQKGHIEDNTLQSHKYVNDKSTFHGNVDSFSSVEKTQRDIGFNTTISGGIKQGEQIVLDIPIKYVDRKSEVRSKVENVEFLGSSKQTTVNEGAPLKDEEVIQAPLKNDEDTAKYKMDSELEGDSSKHSGKKAIVADILKQFGQPTALDDSNVTYVEKEEQCSDGFKKTHIFVESKTTEEIDLFDEPDLTDLWNTTTTTSPQRTAPGSTGSLPEEIESRTTKKTVLKDVTGEQAEEWIGNVIHSGLKTGAGKSINVEILEESFGTIEYDKGDFPTPFHVEEAEDYYNIEESVTSKQESSIPTKKQQDEPLVRESSSKVEEVTEGGHIDEETDYFVYVPDDNAYLEEEEEEETLRGQIHTEEEAQLKYSWQDEFLQGSQGRKSLSELLKNALATEQSSAGRDTSDENRKSWSNEDEKEQLHTESIVIERKIEVPQEMKSSIIDLLSKDVKDPQEKLKGALDCLQGKLPQDLVDELSALTSGEQTQSSSLAVDIKKVGQTEESGVVTIVAEINVSQTVDADDIDISELAEGVQSEVTTIHASNIKSSDDLKSFLQKESLSFAKESDNYQESYHFVTKGSNNNEEHYTEEISVKGPTTTSIHFSPTKELSIGQLSTDAGKFIKNIEFSPNEQVTHGTVGSEHDSACELSSTEVNRSEHHLTIGSSRKQIIFEGPVSDTLKLDLAKNTQDTSEQNVSIRHIKISPTENFQAEQIIFHGPIFKTTGNGQKVPGDLAIKDDYADSVSQVPETLAYGGNQSGVQERIIQENNYVVGASKTVSSFKINSGGLSQEVLFEGSMPQPHDLNITLDTTDNEVPTEYNSATQKVQVAKQIKYRGYVSEPQSSEHTVSLVESKDQPNINTSVHHIKLSPNREQIIFEGPISSNFQIREDGSHVEDKNIFIRHMQLGSPDMSESHTSEEVMFEGPTKESYESSEYMVTSPSGESTESERSIKHIKLGPTEKSFTFQMDITKIATHHSGDDGTQERSMVVTEGHRDISQSYSELKDDSEVAESGYGEDEIAVVSQIPYSVTSQQVVGELSEIDKTVQLQRIVQQGHMVTDDKRVAIVYLDDEEDEEEPDQDYLRRSF
ncbi:synemin [Engystomops pustulosus]|uniref:synemin n=1 Tax=Engystomops pustulosus TaxID=76066 RepID=UPI003AFA9304